MKKYRSYDKALYNVNTGPEEEMANSTWAEWSGGLQGKGRTVKVLWKKAPRQRKQ